MEVADSHMTEHFSTLASSHADIDMAGEYYDEEYMMHDATEATNDEEIYDAEIDEQPEHDEVEMDEYTDGVADDNETHMGTYVSGDDTTATDVTVEDVQLRSSPVPSATPRGAPLHPISPHAAQNTDLPINEAPADTPVIHSPHSVATLVDDSETHLAQGDGVKEDLLNEVIDVTDIDDHPSALSGDVVKPVETEHDVPQNGLDDVEQELYESDDLAIVTGSPTVPTDAPDQLVEEGDEDAAVPTNGDTDDAVDVPNHLEIPEQTDQGGHSPIEEALVINQQVRDDAADSMEPSPPVRLCYKDENRGIDKTFDIFTPSDSASQDVELLFHDNRTLFYEPLSSFFQRLRETEYFSSGDWQESEMQLQIDLGAFDLSINEDQKDTDNVSLFNLSFVWSGLGLEGPLYLLLQRYPERFSVRFARLIEQAEQRDLQIEEGEELHGVQHEDYEAEVYNEAESSGVDGKSTIQHEIEDNENDSDEGDEAGAPNDLNVTEENGRSRDAHEDENAGPPEAEPPKALDDQHQETSSAHGDVQNPQGLDLNASSEHIARDRGVALVQETEENASSPNAQRTTEDAVDNTDLCDNDENPSSHQLSLNLPQNAPETQVFQNDEYREYEIGENDLASRADPNGVSASPWEHAEEYDSYEENYEDAGETAEGRSFADDVTNDSAGSDEAKSTPLATQTEAQGSAPNSNLKRNIDDLEYETYETPSAPSSPASDHKRVKHT